MRIEEFLFCESVRNEITGQLTLVGLFPTDVIGLQPARLKRQALHSSYQYCPASWYLRTFHPQMRFRFNARSNSEARPSNGRLRCKPLARILGVQFKM